jgi:branched-chain amino acid transport system substrate-binding protein
MDDPFAAPVIQLGIQQQLEAGGIETVYETVYPPDTTNFDTIAADIQASGAELVAQGAVFEDGVGLVRSFQRIDFNPEILSRRRRRQQRSVRGRHRPRNTEGIFCAVSWRRTPTR